MGRCFVCGRETQNESTLLNQKVCDKCYEKIKNISTRDPDYEYYIGAVKLILQNYVNNL
ncbi:sigma factor G inhibitor Gin [Calorimonas adulescens]|jgi:Inhibitor of sigma-G Gin.|uniref:CsfB protein n=1 Tax=Calorimonas adulescens TaxID=2606906 RepID=A0A5D8Q987_9THEO|nr:sigma factor G inhibitor Gin [Calorimonas adulescens]TZE81062.1 CsfB protein [Calorimonas adulescens]